MQVVVVVPVVVVAAAMRASASNAEAAAHSYVATATFLGTVTKAPEVGGLIGSLAFKLS